MPPKNQPLPGEQELIKQILSFKDDPLNFVLYVFPWGEPNTPLANTSGPREWQVEVLTQMRDHIAINRRKVTDQHDPELCRIARSSGRGIGKSAFLAWVALWLVSTTPSATVIVSANTEGQLNGTTFPEMRKWATMAIHSHWWDHAAMSIKPTDWLITSMKKTTKLDQAYWYIQARLWSEETPDAYAGAHSQEGMAVLFDEASGIASNIWPVAEGFFTDKTTHRFWLAISNPRNPSGAFFECFNKGRDFWNSKSIDARSVPENDQTLYKSIIAQYGADSDQARVEVYGKFPHQGDNQFISRTEIEEASTREVDFKDHGAPLIMGVDPARFGNDAAVIAYRRGKDAKSIPMKSFPKTSLANLAEEIITSAERHKPDAILIEGDGVGAGLIEILQIAQYKVIEVKTGGGALDKEQYMNHRVEMWGKMRSWLATGCIPDDDKLIEDLAAPEYKYTLKGQLQLEAKEQMKKRGFASPDRADALAITFSKKIPRLDSNISIRHRQKSRLAKNANWSIF